MRRVDSLDTVTGLGIRAEAALGRSRRQVLLLDQDMLNGFGLKPGQTRENIVVGGLRLAGLPPGTSLRGGEACLEATGDCSPCEFLDTLRPGLAEAIRGQRGRLARVAEGDVIRVGDTAALEGQAPE